MATTSRFGLHYLTATDAPDIAGLGQTLAQDVESLVFRAFPVVDAAARVALTGVTEGMLVTQQNDDTLWKFTHSNTWAQITGSTSGGGGGGGSGTPWVGVAGKWRAGSNQSLSNSVDTVLAYGTTENDSPVVTRATTGSGHKFTLAEDGIYTVTTTTRIIPGAVGSRFAELRNSAQTVRYVATGNQGGPGAWTGTFSVTDRFAAGQELVVIATQSSGGTLTTQYQGTSITDGFVRLTICKITG